MPVDHVEDGKRNYASLAPPAVRDYARLRITGQFLGRRQHQAWAASMAAMTGETPSDRRSSISAPAAATVAVRLERMTEEEFGSWKADAEVHFARSVTRSGVPAEAAASEAADTFRSLLPDGAATAGHHLWYAYDGDRRVGFLWLRLTGATAFVYNIAVEQDQRRKGYGGAIMEAGERWSRANGAATIGLHVFTHNHGARELYRQIGYVETGRRLSKCL
ncbi:GNAT family N-acetyltransferase [Plantactinospora siamensis]|uniref:GNAT family N-acetyltransferase n=1 Tax=Plantactinospora siamensis TaxID=555372 RepID=A0ABV6P3G5_9ACTN